MSLKKERFIKGIILAPDTIALDGIEGEIKVDSATGKIQVTLKDGVNPSTAREIITSSQTQTLTNKTLDVDNNSVSNIETDNLKAGVLNVSGTLSAASDTQVPSALAAKTYSDSVASTAASNLSSHASTSSGVHGVTGSIVGTSDSQALTNKTINADLNTITNIDNADIKAGAAIDASKIADGSVSNAEFQYLGNVTSDIQTQLNGKEASFTTLPVSKGGTNSSTALNNNRVIQSSGGAIVEAAAITASRALVSDANGIPTHSAVTSTTLGFLDATSSVQTQLNSKVNASGGTLTNGSIVTPVRSDVKQDTKANLTTYALTASNGQLVFATDTKEMFQVVDTLLVAVGGGEGVGGVDILFTQTFETAALTDFTQTGLSLSTSNPLHGEVSALLTHQAAINQSFKQIIPVDRKFRGETMTLRLNAKSNASAGNVTINIYDETNAANIVASEQLELSNDTSGAISRVGFTIPETCASISYTITALPEAGSPVTRIDDIICELAETALLETAVEVPVVTAWQGYTPTFQGFGTPTNVEFEWRQVGENVEIRGKFVSGTSTAVEARVGLPAGLTSAGTSLIPSLQVVGKANAAVNNTTNFGGMSVLIEPSTAYITFGRESSTINGTTKANGDAIIAASGVISFFASVPCAGLSATITKTIPLTQSGLVQEGDSYLFVSGNAGQALTANVTNIPFANIQSSIGDAFSFNGSQVTILKGGVFDFSATATTTTGVGTRLGIYKNGTLVSTGIGATISTHSYSISLTLAVNDVISFRLVDANGTLSNSTAHTLQVTHQGSLKQVSVSSDQKITIPTSELRMEGASSRGSTATAIVRFDNVAKLRGDAFTVESDAVLGTRITMKKAGKLDISTSIYNSNNMYASITRNQSNLTANPTTADQVLNSGGNGTASSGPYIAISWNGFVSVGDIIRVSTGSTPTAAGNSNLLNLSFQEQDIQVSVSNTLPQFSESDSSVRVSGWAGVGSTGSKIGRYSSVLSNIGTAIEYVPSSINGDSFVVKESGIYNINSFFDAGSTAGSGWIVGLSVDSPNLAANIYDIPVANQLSEQLINSNGELASASWQGYLTAGQIVRAQFGNTLPASIDRASFTISKVGKPNVTGVNVTPFVNVPQPESQSIESLTGTSTFGSTNTGVPVFTIGKDTANGIIAIDSSAAAGTSFRALKPCRVNISAGGQWTSSAGTFYITRNSTTLTAVTVVNGALAYQTIGAAGHIGNASAEVQLQVGDILRVQKDSGGVSSNYTVTLLATALSDQILTAPESFSTDTASLSYASSAAYTLSTLQNAPVGSYITFTYAANTNTRTQTTTRPTQTDADMNVNGMLIYTRAYNAASTAAQPAAFAIQIGKGMKGVNLNLYKSTGKATSGSLDYVILTNDTAAYGAGYKEYNEATGILIIDAAAAIGTNTARTFVYSDGSTTNSGYLVINASKSPALTGVPQLLPRIATLSDVKASGTAGGTATSGSYQTRTLNTLSDPTGIVTSLASNQFTLPAGEYYIEASAPGLSVDYHKAKIRNITDSTDALLGTTEYSLNTAAYGTSSSKISGNIVISSAKVFELQHRVTFTKATFGFGGAASIGDNELFSIVKITKVK